MASFFSRKLVAVLIALLVLTATFFVFQGGSDTRNVTAYFDRTVSVYKGSDVRVMGVRIGTVTAVVPEGDRVRVAMQYDGEYKLPADAKAAIVTPTLTADRFVQIAPAYTGGERMADNAKIALPETGTPVELDRIYQSLSDVTQALGPNGANKDGALDTLLTAGTKSLKGNGKLGNQTLLNLSAAVQTFGDNSGPLFNSVENMSKLTDTLAANDRLVGQFMGDLTSVSAELADERGNLAKALAALARAVGTVRSFVHDNRSMVSKDVRQLSEILGVLAKRKDELNTVTRIGALGLDNLTLANDNKTKSVGSRLQATPNVPNLPALLCGVVKNSAGFEKSGPLVSQTCELFKVILKPFVDSVGADPSQNQGPSQRPQIKLGGTAPATSLEGLLDSLKAGTQQ
jgi:virulence factor Mce-like protein